MRLASPSTLQLLCKINKKTVSRHQRLTDPEPEKSSPVGAPDEFRACVVQPR